MFNFNYYTIINGIDRREFVQIIDSIEFRVSVNTGYKLNVEKSALTLKKRSAHKNERDSKI